MGYHVLYCLISHFLNIRLHVIADCCLEWVSGMNIGLILHLLLAFLRRIGVITHRNPKMGGDLGIIFLLFGEHCAGNLKPVADFLFCVLGL